MYILLIRADKKQGYNTMAIVHTTQNQLLSPLVDNDVGHK